MKEKNNCHGWCGCSFVKRMTHWPAQLKHLRSNDLFGSIVVGSGNWILEVNWAIQYQKKRFIMWIINVAVVVMFCILFVV